MTHGRAVPPLDSITFESTGRTIHIRPLASLLSTRIHNELLKRHEREGLKPTPPVEEIDYGNQTVLEANEAHPVYLARRERWLREVFVPELSDIILRTVVELGVECEIDTDAVAATRAQLERIGTPLDPTRDSDKYIYVVYLCIGNEDELDLLRERVFRVSQVTKGAVADAIAQFQRDLQGQEHLEMENPAVARADG